ncbi:MAG TPA: hypothetical protein VL332_03195 [Candidatus Saccharimonadaceae bacterium]|nr:hypothetical protein [Candidatus Saccharimonadaceae bacterium]
MRAPFLLAAALLLAPAVAHADADHPRTVAPFAATEAQAESVRYVFRINSSNLMGLTISNYGFVGNNFISRDPSMEYPLGSGFEHMVRGGLWIGAKTTDDPIDTVRVTTAAVDGSAGSASQGATEFTPAGNDIRVRSTLSNNAYYDPQHAVSEQDYISEYSDRPAKHADGQRESHRPLNVLVHQENYCWSFADFAHFMILHYVIKNLGAPLTELYVGFYSELASGNKNDYSTWPPSSGANSVGGGSWYLKKQIAYEDSLRLFLEHYCASGPIPSGCNYAHVPEWVGFKLLGVRPGNVADTADKKITLEAWNYAPGSALRDEDRERYAIMKLGTKNPLTGDSLQPQTGDPVELMAVGPFHELDAGDSIVVDFALVGGGGDDLTEVNQHARFAQRAFDRNYIVPIPPPSPRMRVVARNEALDIYWDDSPENAIDPTSPIPMDFEGYRVYLSEDRINLHRVAQFDKATPPNDTTGYNTGFAAVRLATPKLIDGVPYFYKYSVPSLRNGFKYFVAVTAYDLGSSEIESLESGTSQNKSEGIPGPAPDEKPANGRVTVYPNPYRVEAQWDAGQLVRDHYLWFTNLPSRCALKIFTLSGDLVFEKQFDGASYHGEGARGIFGPTEHDVPPPTLSGTTFGWNLITREDQAAATGLYLYSVENKDTGKRDVGKFLIVKSDKERN